ncbi:MAG: terminase family protein [Candidatus Micrarchaeota archaeon]
MRQCCAKDFLFWLAGFVWTYDPRAEPFHKIPFIPYQFQEEAALEILWIFGRKDLLIEKSRDMGASWLCLAIVTWLWLFHSGKSFLLVSRVEDYVDKPGNPKALFWKIDYILKNLPKWLLPKGYNESDCRSKMHIENPENGSVIDGESTTENVARGDRRTAILLDEFAAVRQGHNVLSATRDATNCRIFNSTPKGTNNAFYDIRQTNIQKLRLHWSMHPMKSAGLYKAENGELKILKTDGYPENYEPVLDGKLRSPWYDNECSRTESAQEIAQELDIDYLGSGYQYFSPSFVNDSIRKYARPPILIGDLEYDEITAEPIRFVENEKGSLRLWFLLDRNGKPSIPEGHRTVAGADVAAGTGASNSCLAAWNSTTTEKLAEFANAYIRPEAFAKQSIAICRWLNNAFLIWESNGPGRQFGSRVMDLHYGNIYFRRREEAIGGKISDIPGWASTKETKLVILGNYRAKLEKDDCVNRSKIALEETLEYIFTPDGDVIHSRATNKTDPSGAKSNHGDRVIADALGLHAINERIRQPMREKPEIPIGCLAWRNKMREQEKQESNRELDKSWR